MSNTVQKKGFIAPLLTPIRNNEVLEEIQENLWDSKSNISINNEGTLVYSDIFRHKDMSEREDIYGLNIGSDTQQCVEMFIKDIRKLGIITDEGKIESYFEVYYNGVDSGISMLTLERYLENFDKLVEER